MDPQNFPPELVHVILWGTGIVWAALMIYGFVTNRKAKQKQPNLGKGTPRKRLKSKARKR